MRRSRPATATPLHVDLVKNEWMAGLQVRVACVEADHDRVHISHASPEYEALLRQPIVNPVDGQVLYLEKTAPDVAFPVLSHMYSNDYFFVTDAHEVSGCQFRQTDAVGMSIRLASE